MDADDFAAIFDDAASIMGIKSNSDIDQVGSAFSKDVLRVELGGPDEEHLTVIDVPGIFENPTPGLATQSDIELVKGMVKGYIHESRTMILAVVPCTGDIANQKILTFAAEADPHGKRTLGVLTKPDLAVVENATRQVVIDLVEGKRRDLHLGYCVVKNRGADDADSTLAQRQEQEEAFFAENQWTRLLSGRLGTPALRTRLQQLLMDRTKSEFPKVRQDIADRLKHNKKLLNDMGEPRVTTEQQRSYISKVASRFTQLKNYGLDAYYTRDELFAKNSDLRLITRIREINEGFSDTMQSCGHTMEFNDPEQDDSADDEAADTTADRLSNEIDSRGNLYVDALSFSIPSAGEAELSDVVNEPYDCPTPSTDDIMEYIKAQYRNSCGYELGSYGDDILRSVFKEQAKSWSSITRAHVTNAILVVHNLIRDSQVAACPDTLIRDELWLSLIDELVERYKAATAHVEFLLSVEFSGKSLTYDSAFQRAIYKAKRDRMESSKADGQSMNLEGNKGGKVLRHGAYQRILKSVVDKIVGREGHVAEFTCLEIYDALRGYDSVALNRFVDVVCQQAIDYFLLFSENGPLSVLCDRTVLGMNAEQLAMIAGEDMASRGMREALEETLMRSPRLRGFCEHDDAVI